MRSLEWPRPALHRWPMVPALATIVLAARANGLAVLDSSFREAKDPVGFRDACLASRELGFDGKVFEDSLQFVAGGRCRALTEQRPWFSYSFARCEGATPEGQGKVLAINGEADLEACSTSSERASSRCSISRSSPTMTPTSTP